MAKKQSPNYLPEGAILETMPSGRDVYRVKDDIVLLTTEAKYYYNLLEEIIQIQFKFREQTEWIHILAYGSILESILKKVLQNDYINMDNAGSIQKFFEEYSTIQKNDAGKYRRRYNQGEHSQEVRKFDEDLRDLNETYNEAKHQGKQSIEARLCLRYLLDFIYYLSNLEVPVEIIDEAYEGTVFSETNEDIVNAKQSYWKRKAKKGIERKEIGFGLEQGTEPFKDPEEKNKTNGGATDENVFIEGTKLTSKDGEQRIPVLVCLDVSVTMHKSGAYDCILAWLKKFAEEFRGYQCIDLGFVVFNVDGCEAFSFQPLRRQKRRLEALSDVAKSEGVSPISKALKHGIGSLKDYIENSKFVAVSPKIIVFTDCDIKTYNSIPQNAQRVCEVLNLPEELNIDLYGYRFDIGKKIVSMGGNMNVFEECLKEDAEKLVATLDEPLERTDTLVLVGISGYYCFGKDEYLEALQDFVLLFLKGAKTIRSLKIGFVLLGEGGEVIALPILKPLEYLSNITSYLRQVGCMTEGDVGAILSALDQTCSNYLETYGEVIVSQLIILSDISPENFETPTKVNILSTMSKYAKNVGYDYYDVPKMRNYCQTIGYRYDEP